MSEMMLDALAFIRELTEDNEYLKTALTACEARYESRKESGLEELLELRLEVEELAEENERLRGERDTQDIIVKDLSYRNKELQTANEELGEYCMELEKELGVCSG